MASPKNTHPWTTRPGASLSSYLKGDVPALGDTVLPSCQPSSLPEQEVTAHIAPPAEITWPVSHLLSLGSDTPNSMTVERATDPSLRSYSPTSSIRAPSEADYTASTPPPPAVNIPSPPHLSAPHSITDPPFYHPRQIDHLEMSESVSTLHESAGEPSSASSISKKQAAEESRTFQKSVEEAGASAIIVIKEDVPAMPPPQETGHRTVEVRRRITTAPPPSAKAFLGKGKIDAKAQDDFIAFMLGKK